MHAITKLQNKILKCLMIIFQTTGVIYNSLFKSFRINFETLVGFVSLTLFFGKKILPPESLKLDDRKVFIAAAQSYDEIIQEIKYFRGNTDSVINGIFF